MTPANTPAAPAERITLDDLKHRAEVVKDLAVTDARGAVSSVLDTNEARTLLIVAGVVVVAASIAFFLGTRATRVTYTDV